MDFLGYKVKGRMVAASCPATESLENIIECEKNGAAAVILKSASSIRKGDGKSRSYFLDKNKSLWCSSGFDREIIPLSEAIKLTEESRKSTNLIIVPSITECTLDKEVWLKSCELLENAGAHGIQLDLFYVPELLVEEDFYKKFIELLNTLTEKIKIPIMPKLSINIPVNLAVNIFNKAKIKYVSCLDSIKTPNAHTDYLHGDFPSLYGNWMFPITRQYTKVLSDAGFQVCAGGGVVSEQEASELIRLGANTIQLATEVLINGYKRFSEIEAKLDINASVQDGFTGERIIAFDKNKCAGCGKCMNQAFCNVVKTFIKTGDNTSCEGCGLCAQLCKTGALKMLKKN